MAHVQIFISYAREDFQAVKQLYRRLQAAGYKPWMDKVDLHKGVDFEHAIPQVIRESDLFLVCLSTKSVGKRGFVQREINTALDLWKEKLPDDLYIFPVRLDECIAPERVRKFNWTDTFGEDAEDEWEGLLRSLHAAALRLGKAPATTQSAPSASTTPAPSAIVAPAPQLLSVNVKPQTITPSQPVEPPGDFIEDLNNGVKLEMVAIPGGTFLMGSPKGEGSDSERPQHRVTLSPFFIGRYQVTQAQWQAVMGSNPSNFKGENLPVENVSWNDAVEFCRKLSGQTGKTYRLPTEAEWEYACRAGTTTAFAFGSSLSSEQANFNGNYPYGGAAKGVYREKTTPVGSFAPNNFGLYDMHGNVWEWCQDWYGSYTSGEASDPQGPSSGQFRVLRGGSWVDYGYYCRSAFRDWGTPGYRFHHSGLRVVVIARTP